MKTNGIWIRLVGFASIFGSLVSNANAILVVGSAGPGTQVVSLDETTGALLQEPFAGPDPAGGNTRDLIYGPDGNLYVASLVVLSDGSRVGKVRRYNGITGAFIDDFVSPGSGGLGSAPGLTFGPHGNLYVTDFEGDVIRRYDGATGAYLGVFASGGGLDAPNMGLEFGPDGNLYVASTGTQQVLRYDGTSGAFIDVFADSVALDFVFGPDQHLYATDYFNDQILRYDGATGAFLGVFASGPGTNSVRGLTFGPNQDLYVAVDDIPNRTGLVYHFDGSSGNLINSFDLPGNTPWGITAPSGVAVPEPSALGLGLLGLAALLSRRRRNEWIKGAQ